MKLKFMIVVLCLATAAIIMFYANEARKEIYYLCANFSTGTPYSSVIQQLKTMNLSGYKLKEMLQDKTVTISSKLHFHVISCSMGFDEEEKVVWVLYD